jgi:hypothetical protein
LNLGPTHLRTGFSKTFYWWTGNVF